MQLSTGATVIRVPKVHKRDLGDKPMEFEIKGEQQTTNGPLTEVIQGVKLLVGTDERERMHDYTAVGDPRALVLGIPRQNELVL